MSEKFPQPNSLDSMEGVPSPEDIKLSRLDLGELSLWVDRYNAQFGWGGLLGRVIIGTARETKEMGAQDDEPPPPVLETSENEQRLSFAEIKQRTSKLTTESGLALEPIRGDSVIMSSNLEEDDYPSELRVNLFDGKRFVHYLETLNGKKLLDSQRTGLVTVAESLMTQLKKEYELESSQDDRFLELFGNASRIIAEYERLEKEGASGLVDSIKELKRLCGIAKQGYLREELLAEKEGLLKEVGGNNFGPSKWHTDSSGEDYVKRWEHALNATRAIGKNPKAEQLFKRVVENLLSSADYVKKDITARRTDADKKRTWHQKQLTLLDNVVSTLRAIETR